MKTSGFWSHFEESVLEADSHCRRICATQTRQREESDQRSACVSGNIKTITNTREESDQDVQNESYSAIPTSSLLTKTITKTREESDQDESDYAYRVVPVHFRCGPTKVTETREETDQDESSHAYAAIPANARVRT
jgi:hypothetical protein